MNAQSEIHATAPKSSALTCRGHFHVFVHLALENPATASSVKVGSFIVSVFLF